MTSSKASAAFDFFQWFTKIKNSLLVQITGLSINVDEITDDRGVSHWVRTVVVSPADVQHRAANLGLGLSPGFASVGAKSQVRYIFEDTFLNEKEARQKDSIQEWRARIPKNTDDIKKILNRESLAERKVFEVALSTSAYIGAGPGLEWMGLKAGKAGVDAKFSGGLALRFQQAGPDNLAMAVKLKGLNNKNAGFKIGGSGDSEDPLFEVADATEVSVDLLPNYLGLNTSHTSETVFVKHVSIDLKQKAATEFLDALLTRTDSSLHQIEQTTRAMSVGNAPIELSNQLINLEAIFGKEPVIGVTPEGHGENKMSKSLVEGGGGIFVHGYFSQHTRESLFTITAEDGESLTLLQNTFMLDAGRSLFGNINSSSQRRLVQLTNAVDSKSGDAGEMLELLFTSQYEGKSISVFTREKIFSHFISILPDESVKEIFGKYGENFDSAKKFKITTHVSFGADTLAAIRDEKQPAHAVIESIVRRHLKETMDKTGYGVVSELALKDMIHKLENVLDKGLPFKERLKAFKLLRFNPAFQEYAVGFFLTALPREQWTQFLNFSVTADFIKSDGSVISRSSNLGRSLNEPLGQITSKQIADAKASSMGSNGVQPKVILESIENSCARIMSGVQN
jgi:hypothetical protein